MLSSGVEPTFTVGNVNYSLVSNPGWKILVYLVAAFTMQISERDLDPWHLAFYSNGIYI